MHSGANMIDLYYWTTPNGHKITMFLEEVGLNYKIIPINIGVGDQFKPDFLEIAPNNRIPAIVDHAPADGGSSISVFESGAILQYLAEKDRKSTRLNSSHVSTSYAVFCLKKKHRCQHNSNR